MYGVEEREEEAGQDSAAKELGDLALCFLEDDTGTLSAGSTDAPAPELFGLEDITQVGSPMGLTRRGSLGEVLGSVVPHGPLGREDGEGYHSRRRRRSSHPFEPPSPKVSETPIFQTLAEMQERLQRFSAVLQGETLANAGTNEASTVVI